MLKAPKDPGLTEELDDDMKQFITTMPREEIESYRRSLMTGQLTPNNIVTLREPRSGKEFKVRANVFSSIEILNDKIMNESPYQELSFATNSNYPSEYVVPNHQKLDDRSRETTQPSPRPLTPQRSPKLPLHNSQATTPRQNRNSGAVSELPLNAASFNTPLKDSPLKYPMHSEGLRYSSFFLPETTNTTPSLQPPGTILPAPNNYSSVPRVDSVSSKPTPASALQWTRRKMEGWKNRKRCIIIGLVVAVLLVIGIIVIIVVTKKGSTKTTTTVMTPSDTTTRPSNTLSSTLSSSTQSATSSTTSSTTGSTTSSTTSSTTGSTTSSTTSSITSSDRSTTTTATTTTSADEPSLGPCTTFGSGRICPTAISATLIHSLSLSKPIATVGFNMVSRTLLLTWQDETANEVYISTLDTTGNQWSITDGRLSLAHEVVSLCKNKHVCTILGIYQRCSDGACGQQNMTQYCCTCGKPPVNGVVCSMPGDGNELPIPLTSHEQLVGSAWTERDNTHIYFLSSTNALRNLADYSIIELAGFYPDGNTFPIMPICTSSCSILSSTSTMPNAPEPLYGAVVRNTGSGNSATYFCKFQNTQPPDSELTRDWCTRSSLPIRSEPDRIAVTVDASNDVWYIVDTDASSDGRQFVVYSVSNDGDSLSISKPIDIYASSGVDGSFSTHVGQAFVERSLFIVMQSSTGEHIVIKYEIGD